MHQADRYLEALAEQERQQREAEAQARPQMIGVQQSAYGWQRMATFGEAWNNLWTRWDFAGRASRSEYWFAQLELFFFNLGLTFLFTFLSVVTTAAPIWMLLSWVISLIITIPVICMVVRRLHDIGYSGWWWWISLIPIAGWIVLFVFSVLPSEPRPNRYGPVPFLERMPNE